MNRSDASLLLIAIGSFGGGIGACATAPSEPLTAPPALAPSSSPLVVLLPPAPAASSATPIAPAPIASAPASAARLAAPPRRITANGVCVGVKFVYADVEDLCACETEAQHKMIPTPNMAVCDYVGADQKAVESALSVSAEVDPPTLAPGRSGRLSVRYTNRSDEPLHVLLSRHAEEPFPKLMDGKGDEVAPERDRRCREVATVGLAELSLIVLLPGGVLERSTALHANRERRVPDSDGGCRSAVGSRLPPGTYGLRWSSDEVWDLRDTQIETTLTVK